MSDFRCFAPILDSLKGSVTLSPFESHHLVATNRARQGDRVIVFNGGGTEWIASLDLADKRQSSLSCKEVRETSKPFPEITLAIAVIKGKTFDTILRQSAELGVIQIQPLQTERTLVQIKEVSSKMGKWRNQLIEGCKQSGNPWLPELMNPQTINRYLKEADLQSAFLASLEDSAQSWNHLSPKGASTLFIGPEGDFSPEEYRLLMEKGARPVTLGNYVLRSETAVVTAISQLSLRIKLENGR